MSEARPLEEGLSVQGIGASPGIAIGYAHLLETDPLRVRLVRIEPESTQEEIRRLREAVVATGHRLQQIRDQVKETIGSDQAMLFDAYMAMIQDPILIDTAAERIENELVGAEYAISSVTQELATRFEQVPNDYMRARSADIRDVGSRLLKSLRGDETFSLLTLDHEAIILAPDLAASDTAQMDATKVIGFATDRGSHTSHTAIMARSLEIPAVVALGRITERVQTGDLLILDGTSGKVFVNPDAEIVERYRRFREQFIAYEENLDRLGDLPAETTDHYRVQLLANIELPEEVKHVRRHGAEGIGLYRTEYLFMNRMDLPSEDEQYEAYRQVTEQLAPGAVTIRTIDLGGDKFSKSIQASQEINPFLGWRAIRLCLERTDIFQIQLRAILRASTAGNVNVMFPMISGVDELRQVKELVERAKSELRREGIPFNEKLKLGAMIEIPSAVLTADDLAREVDFFSLGTNDLIQYALAIDRSNDKVAYLYDPMHPAVLRLIQLSIDAAHRAHIPISLCGEMAGDPIMTLLLLGMGIDQLSMASVVIPEIKRLIRGASMSDAREMTREALSYASPAAVRNCVQDWLARLFPDHRFEFDLSMPRQEP